MSNADSQRSELDLRTVVENISSAIALVDASGRFTLFNRRFLALFGLAADSNIKNVNDTEWSRWKVFDAGGRLLAVDEHPVRKAVLTRQPVTNELVGVRLPGGQEVTWVLVSASPVLSDDGAVDHLICTYHDITGHKRAEEALRESEALLRAVIDTIAEPVYVKDAHSHLTLVNAALVELVGKPRDQLVGHTDREFFDEPGVVEAILEHDRRVIESGTVQTFEEVVPTPHGHRIMLNTKAPRRDGAGRIVGLVGVARDITELKRSELEKTRILSEIDAQRSRLQAIVDSLPVGLWLTDASGKMLIINDHARAIWGGRAANSIEDYAEYRAWEAETGQLITPDQMPLARALRGEVCRELVVDFERLDGTRGTQMVSSSPVKAQDGSVQGAVAVGSDITERRQMETALLEADRRKNEFLAVLSHELRNPLAPIANSLAILERAAAGGEQANRARQVISRQVAHLSALVNDLLDVTRITSNKIQLQKERFELNEVVLRAVEDNRSLFERADVRLSLTSAPHPVTLVADRTRVVQVVGNLLQNAAKFTLPGGTTRVSVAREADQAVVRVADDGLGIEPETLAELFQPFMQADHSLARSKGGLGLGLAVVKGLVELHGGSVSAHSGGLGQGTELVVRLPLATAAALEAEPHRRLAPKVARRILIIEDNVDGADSLRELLELGDHEVVTAYGGREGLATARRFLPEVVLCDIGLPGMNGFEVAREFRADERLKETFLVALSGYALPEDVQRAAAAGFQRHLAKPPSIEKLEALLSEVPAR